MTIIVRKSRRKSRRDGGGTSRAATLRSYEAVFEIARSFLKSDIEQRPSKQHETSYACARHGIPRISIAANRRVTSNKAIREKRKYICDIIYFSFKLPAVICIVVNLGSYGKLEYIRLGNYIRFTREVLLNLVKCIICMNSFAIVSTECATVYLYAHINGTDSINVEVFRKLLLASDETDVSGTSRFSVIVTRYVTCKLLFD